MYILDVCIVLWLIKKKLRVRTGQYFIGRRLLCHCLFLRQIQLSLQPCDLVEIKESKIHVRKRQQQMSSLLLQKNPNSNLEMKQQSLSKTLPCVLCLQNCSSMQKSHGLRRLNIFILFIIWGKIKVEKILNVSNTAWAKMQILLSYPLKILKSRECKRFK